MTRTDRPSSRPTLTGVGRPTNLASQESTATEKRRRRLLAIGAAAEYLSVSRATIERLVCRGELPRVKVARSTRFDVEDLDDYIDINRCRNRKLDGLRNVTLSRGKGRDHEGM
jgi:excisionase family DNA binding protein